MSEYGTDSGTGDDRDILIPFPGPKIIAVASNESSTADMMCGEVDRAGQTLQWEIVTAKKYDLMALLESGELGPFLGALHKRLQPFKVIRTMQVVQLEQHIDEARLDAVYMENQFVEYARWRERKRLRAVLTECHGKDDLPVHMTWMGGGIPRWAKENISVGHTRNTDARFLRDLYDGQSFEAHAQRIVAATQDILHEMRDQIAIDKVLKKSPAPFAPKEISI